MKIQTRYEWQAEALYNDMLADGSFLSTQPVRTTSSVRVFVMVDGDATKERIRWLRAACNYRGIRHCWVDDDFILHTMD